MHFKFHNYFLIHFHFVPSFSIFNELLKMFFFTNQVSLSSPKCSGGFLIRDGKVSNPPPAFGPGIRDVVLEVPSDEREPPIAINQGAFYLPLMLLLLTNAYVLCTLVLLYTLTYHVCTSMYVLYKRLSRMNVSNP